MREYTPDPRPYELMTIFTPDVADDTVLDVLERVTEYVRGVGGTVYQVLYDAPWGRRRFAYPIRYGGRDVRDGIYSVIHFDLRPGQITEVERDLKLDEQVLRFLLTIRDHAPATADDENEPAPERAPIQSGDLHREAATAREAAEAASAERAAAANPAPSRPASPPETPAPVEQPATAPAPEEIPAPVNTTTAEAAPTESATADVPTAPDAVANTVEPTDRQNESGEAATARPVTSETATELNSDAAQDTTDETAERSNTEE